MISDRIYRRSVLKNMNPRGQRLTRCADSGLGAVVGDITGSVVASIKTGKYGIYAAYNELCIKGATPLFFNLSATVPAGYCEEDLKECVSWHGAVGERLHMGFGDCAVNVDGNVSEPVLTTCAIGECAGYHGLSGAAAGDDIVLVGRIGLDGIRRVVEKHPEAVRERYSQEFIRGALGAEDAFAIGRAAALARDNGATFLQCVGEGGIYAALWHLAQENGKGFDIDMMSIGVDQEVIELCEVYGINPYGLSSLGCLLVTSPDGCGIVDVMESDGMHAGVLGRMSDGKARIMRLKDEIRYLDVPIGEEADRFCFGGYGGNEGKDS